PTFLLFAADRAQTDPQIGFSAPWIRVPAIVPCGDKAAFTIEVDAPIPLKRSFVQVTLAKDSKLKSSVSSRALAAAVGATASVPVELSRSSPDVSMPETINIRISLDGKSIEFPITVTPLARAHPSAGAFGNDNQKVGTLRDRQGEAASPAPLF